MQLAGFVTFRYAKFLKFGISSLLTVSLRGQEAAWRKFKFKCQAQIQIQIYKAVAINYFRNGFLILTYFFEHYINFKTNTKEWLNSIS